MCSICGGPNYTKCCPNLSGYSIDYSSNSYSQPQPYQNSYPLPYQSCDEIEYPSYVPAFVESVQIFTQITQIALDEGDLRFPKMLALPDQMHKVLDQMMKKSMNQHVDPLCEGCG
ncbi:hypothetical protein Hanom_Chr09g00826891 [Helianthus anomalus]